MDIETFFRIGDMKPTVRLMRPGPAVAAGSNEISGSGTSSSGAGPVPAMSERKLKQVLLDLTEHVQNLQRSLQFSVDDESGETVVRVVDSETKEVIRQIPSEELLAIANRLRSAAGVLVTEQI